MPALARELIKKVGKKDDYYSPGQLSGELVAEGRNESHGKPFG